MSLKISSPIVYGKKITRPSTPIRRRILPASEQSSIPSSQLNRIVEHLIERLEKESIDSSTKILIRLYRHKLNRLENDPDKLVDFLRDIYSSVRRLNPSLFEELKLEEEKLISTQIEPIVVCRSARATIRKLN